MKNIKYLSSGVYDVTFILDTLKADILGEGAFDSGIVRILKEVIDELAH
jgi:hypothetical protein